MEKLKSFFGYIHYRVYIFFKNKGDNVPEFKGTVLLTLIQCFTIVDIMVIVTLIYDYQFPNKFAFLPLLAVLGGLNWYLYERNFDAQKVDKKWGSEAKKEQTKNGWFIGLYMLITFLIPPLYGYLKVNLQVI